MCGSHNMLTRAYQVTAQQRKALHTQNHPARATSGIRSNRGSHLLGCPNGFEDPLRRHSLAPAQSCAENTKELHAEAQLAWGCTRCKSPRSAERRRKWYQIMKNCSLYLLVSCVCSFVLPHVPLFRHLPSHFFFICTLYTSSFQADTRSTSGAWPTATAERPSTRPSGFTSSQGRGTSIRGMGRVRCGGLPRRGRGRAPPAPKMGQIGPMQMGPMGPMGPMGQMGQTRISACGKVRVQLPRHTTQQGTLICRHSRS